MRCLSEYKKIKEKCGLSFFFLGDGGWVGGWEIIFFVGDEFNVYILEINVYIFCGDFLFYLNFCMKDVFYWIIILGIKVNLNLKK